MVGQAFSKTAAGRFMRGIAISAVVVAECQGGAAFAVPVQATAALLVAADPGGKVCSPPPSEVYASSVGNVVLPQPDAAALKAAALKVHNDARAAVGVEPLLWDDELARGAQYWASMIVKTNVQKHDPDAPSGESITGGAAGALLTPEQLMGGLVAEKAWFKNVPMPVAVAACDDIGNGPGHYFGLIRRGAYRLGCGVASRDRFRVIVCRMNPGSAPDGELAWPTTSKPWPERAPDSAKEAWVEAARYDVNQFNKDMTAVNVAVRPGLTWDNGLADAAHWEARKRMLTDTPWEPGGIAGEFITLVSHSDNGDVTNYPVADVQYKDWMNDPRNAAKRSELNTSNWTKVGCGTAIRPVGAENRRMVICRYS